jgi:UDP-N-acetylglucosamine 4,6-dehydratase
MFNEKTVLITGGTGSLGKRLVRKLFEKFIPKKVIVLSRDEFKQHEMEKDYDYDNLRFFLGDVRDKNRLVRAFDGVDYVIHAAALKQVPALEYNPTEAIKTNINGSQNVIDGCIDSGVKKCCLISTDKAVNPINLYGATKLCAEKLFMASNAYAKTDFCAVRYGNVIGSRGSVIPFFQKLKELGAKELPLTHPDMTRFWLTLNEAVGLVLNAMKGKGGIYVPEIKAMTMRDLARAIHPKCQIKEIGVRAGEKMHECLISEDNAEVRLVLDVPESWEEVGIYQETPRLYYSNQVEQMTSEEFLEKLNECV